MIMKVHSFWVKLARFSMECTQGYLLNTSASRISCSEVMKHSQSEPFPMQPCCQWKTLSGGPCSCFQVKHVPGVMGVPRGTRHRQICQPFVDDSLYLKCEISSNIAMSGTRAWGIQKLIKLDSFSTHTSGLGIVWRASPCFNQSDSLEMCSEIWISGQELRMWCRNNPIFRPTTIHLQYIEICWKQPVKHPQARSYLGGFTADVSWKHPTESSYPTPCMLGLGFWVFHFFP